VQEAQAAGARLVTLEVRRENAPARSLYRKLGFVDTGQRRNYYGRGEDAIIMSLALRPDESTSPED
jgi:ribosomal-protein-alanine N-acetyltransferase